MGYQVVWYVIEFSLLQALWRRCSTCVHRLTGKGAADGGWFLNFKIPFTVRIAPACCHGVFSLIIVARYMHRNL